MDINDVDQPCKEVAEVHKFTVVSVFNVDHSPTVLTSTDRFTIDEHVVLRTDNSKRYNFLEIRESTLIIEKATQKAHTRMDSLS
jgi:hypothetical protein